MSGEKKQPPTESGWPAGSIGDISARIGYDVRDLKMAGYSDGEINQLLTGQLTLAELLSKTPASRRE